MNRQRPSFFPGRRFIAGMLGTGFAIAAVHAQTAPPGPASPPAASSVAERPPQEQPKDKEPEVVETPGVVVKGHRNPLGESDKRLKEVQKSLPELNSDAKRKKGATERVVDRTRKYLSDHSDPNKLDEPSKAFLQQQQNSLDREHQGAPSAPPSRGPDDGADPYCRTGSCPK